MKKTRSSSGDRPSKHASGGVADPQAETSGEAVGVVVDDIADNAEKPNGMQALGAALFFRWY